MSERLDALLEEVKRADDDLLEDMLEMTRRRLRELSLPRGQIVMVLIEEDPLRWVMHIERSYRGPTGPEADVFTGGDYPSLRVGLEAAAHGHSHGPEGHRLALRVGCTGYLLAPLDGHPEPRVTSFTPT